MSKYISLVAGILHRCKTGGSPYAESNAESEALLACIDARNAVAEVSRTPGLRRKCWTCAHSGRDDGHCVGCAYGGNGFDCHWEWRWPLPPSTSDTVEEVLESALVCLKAYEEAREMLRGHCAACTHDNSDDPKQEQGRCRHCCHRLIMEAGVQDNWEWRWPIQKLVTVEGLAMQADVLLPVTVRLAAELHTVKEELRGECAACQYAPDDDSECTDCPPECADCDEGSNWRWRWGRTH